VKTKKQTARRRTSRPAPSGVRSRPGRVKARPRTLIIACGALAREFLALKAANRWSHLDITCLPAILHNRPQEIPAAVRRKIRAARARYETILCLYGDCGTGGLLDAVLAEEGIERIDGAHCYAFYAGIDRFEKLMEEEIGSFFLTDYLARHFERLIWRGLGLDRHPELLAAYFGNYRRVVYLAQTQDAKLAALAEAAARRLGLSFEIRKTGLDGMSRFLAPRV
jgi:hypothetical protein